MSRLILAASVFLVLLYRYTAKQRIVVGCPLPEKDAHRLNRVFLRGAFEPDLPFATLYERIRQEYIDGLARQDVPQATLVRDLDQRGQTGSPLFQFAVVDGVDRASRNIAAQQFSDLCLYVEAKGIAVHFDAARYPATAIARLIEHFQMLFQGICGDPAQPIGRLPLLTPREERRVLGTWSRPPAEERYDVERCVHELFEGWAQRQPQAIAVLDDNRAFSYAELNARANRIAWFLGAAGVQAGDFVGLYMRPSLEALAAVMGIYKSGGVYVPLDTEYPEARLGYLLEDAQPRIVLTEARVRESLPAHAGRTVCVDAEAEAIARCPADNPEVAVDLGQIAYINYTSGSTGKPKGVMGYHRGLANYLLGWGKHTWTNERDRFLIRAPFSYGAFHRQFLLPLVWGASTALATPEERQLPVKLMHAVKRHSVTVFDFMPTAWRSANHALGKMVPEQRRELLRNKLRLLVAHGETLDADVVATWRELNDSSAMTILNVCGGTEVSCIAVSYTVPGREMLSPVPIGKPVCAARIYLLDEQLQPVPEGVWGEICYGGPNVTLGYLNRPELTAQRYVPDPFSDDPNARLYRSGDIARHLPDGNLQHLKRSDLQIKLRGYRVELEEIESVLSSHPCVERVVVSAHEYAPGDRRLIAYVLPDAPGRHGDRLVADLRELAGRTLPSYMRPAGFVLLDHLPLTSSGKLDRRALPAPTVSERLGLGDVVAPKDKLEEQLAAIWEDILGVGPIGVNDDFFNIGGDSILAVALLTEIELRMGHDLPLATLLWTRTVATLADAIRKQTWPEPDSTLVLLRPGGPKPPLFLMPHGGLHALAYRGLAERLSPGRAVYGLEPKGVDGRLQPDVSVDAQAATYITAIRRTQPHGPYLLGGWSGGGLIAWEVAQQLQAAGEEIALLAMFDTYAHSYLTLKPPVRRFVEVVGWWLLLRWQALLKLWKPTGHAAARLAHSLKSRGVPGTWAKVRQNIARVLRLNDSSTVAASGGQQDDKAAETLRIRKRLDARKHAFRMDEAAQVARLSDRRSKWMDRLALFLLWNSNKFFASVYAGGYYVEGLSSLPEWKRQLVREHVHVWRAYEPAPFAGRAILFRASQQPPGMVDDPLLCWKGLAAEGMDAIDIPGTHTTIIHSPEFAASLQRYIDLSDRENPPQYERRAASS